MATLSLASPAAAARKEELLVARLRELGSVLVAFSAGVDSAYLLDVAHSTLGDRAVAVTADSPSLARTSLAEAEAFCAARGIRHLILETDEFTHEEYLANDGQRCRHCKSALMRAMNGLAERTAGGAALLLGVIADDFGDVRPGLRAAEEAGARFPLAEVGLTKAEVRLRSRARGLDSWDRPAEPCLSSRVPYGERVTPAALRMIEAAERELHGLGLRECRARHHVVGAGSGALCRIEVPVADLERVLAARERLVPTLRRLGYTSVALDLAGFVSGGLNALLDEQERRA